MMGSTKLGRMKHLAERLGATVLVLLLVFTLVAQSGLAYGVYYNLNDWRKLTHLDMDPLPGCILLAPTVNSRASCIAPVPVGDEAKFSGKLIEVNGQGLAHKSIEIYGQLIGPDFILLTSTTTDANGTFEVVWKLGLSTFQYVEKSAHSSDPNRVFYLYARFNGDEEFVPANSPQQAISVKVRDLITHIDSDKSQYTKGEQALLSITFMKAHEDHGRIVAEDFVEPTAITAAFDDQPVSLEKTESFYTFITPPLTKQHHQLSIMPEGEGFNSQGLIYTIIVSG